MGEDQHYAATTIMASTAVMSDESAHLDAQCAADTSTVRYKHCEKVPYLAPARFVSRARLCQPHTPLRNNVLDPVSFLTLHLPYSALIDLR